MKKYIHKKTGNPYRVVTDNFMFKDNGEWRRGLVLYETLYDNPDGKYFARTKEDFDDSFEFNGEDDTCLSGVDVIAKERERQKNVEGWTSEHDDEHVNGELAQAAACYAHNYFDYRLDFTKPVVVDPDNLWPSEWDKSWYKPAKDCSIESRIRELSKAGALIAAEIDRLERLKIKKIATQFLKDANEIINKEN